MRIVGVRETLTIVDTRFSLLARRRHKIPCLKNLLKIVLKIELRHRLWCLWGLLYRACDSVAKSRFLQNRYFMTAPNDKIVPQKEVLALHLCISFPVVLPGLP